MSNIVSTTKLGLRIKYAKNELVFDNERLLPF